LYRYLKHQFSHLFAGLTISSYTISCGISLHQDLAPLQLLKGSIFIGWWGGADERSGRDECINSIWKFSGIFSLQLQKQMLTKDLSERRRTVDGSATYQLRER